MTKLLDQAIEKARALSEPEQDMAAEALLSVVYKDAPKYGLTPEQVEEVRRIQKDVREGKARIASDSEVAALWKKCGL